MVKNAVDILDDFLAHHLSLVDRIYLADHLSVDGSYELMLARAEIEPRIYVFTYGYEQFFQGAVVTALAKNAAARGADWILPLDTDEFLPYSSGEELRSALKNSASELVRFDWLNCVPKDLPEIAAQIDWSLPFLSLSDEKASSKVGIARDLVTRKNFAIEHGSHEIRLGVKHPPEARPVGRLLHFPIRSMEQARSKFYDGARGYAAMKGSRANPTKHWFLYGGLFDGKISIPEAQSIALRYPKKELQAVQNMATPVLFHPNHQFVGRPEVASAPSRIVRQSSLTRHEARAIIRGREVFVRPVPLWRTRRLLDGTRAFLRRVQGWLAVRLRSA